MTATKTAHLRATGHALLIVLALATVVVPAQAQTPSPNPSATAENEAIVREAFEGWAAGGGNVFDLLSPDVRWTIHGSGPVADTYRASRISCSGDRFPLSAASQPR